MHFRGNTIVEETTLQIVVLVFVVLLPINSDDGRVAIHFE